MNPPTGADQRSFRCLALPAPIVFSDELKPVRRAEEPYVSQSAAEAAAGSTSTAATLRASPARRFTAGHSTGRTGGGAPRRAGGLAGGGGGGGPARGPLAPLLFLLICPRRGGARYFLWAPLRPPP